MSESEQYSKCARCNSFALLMLPFVLCFVDYLAILSAEFLAFLLRNFLIPYGGVLAISDLHYYVAFPFCFLLFIQIKGLYVKRMEFWRIISELFSASVYGMVALIALLYFLHIGETTSRLFVLLFSVFSFIFIVFYRFVNHKLLAKLGWLQLPVLLVGSGEIPEGLLSHIENDSGMGYHFIGYLGKCLPQEAVAANIPLLGSDRNAPDVIRKTGVQNVLVIAPDCSNYQVQEIVSRLQPLVREISFIPDMGSLPLANMSSVTLVDGRVVALFLRNNLAVRRNQIFKRCFDICLTLAGLIVVAPLLLLIAVWIYNDSPGPVIFKHTRIGKNGKKFECYKFRTMCVDAQARLESLLATDIGVREEWEKYFKLKDDPRITKSGAFLRKTSLDELPQVFNVLKGEMSLVGPRPIINEEIPRYGEYIFDYYMVLPGITGAWQTSGRNDVNYQERVQMDSWYVRNWNMWLDIVLLCRTVKVMLDKKGAY